MTIPENPTLTDKVKKKSRKKIENNVCAQIAGGGFLLAKLIAESKLNNLIDTVEDKISRPRP